jgi:Na+/melibiose symporter-like transporter
MVQFTSFAIPLVVPYYLTRIAGWGPLASGALLAFWAAGALAGSGLAPRVVRGLGVKRAAFASGTLVVAGLAGIAAWPAEPRLLTMIACLLLQGVGIGMYQVAYSDLVVAALPPAQRGVAGSLTMVTRTVGIVLGASLLTWIVQAAEAIAAAGGAAARPAFMAAFSTVFMWAALAAGAFFAASALRRGTWSDQTAR